MCGVLCPTIVLIWIVLAVLTIVDFMRERRDGDDEDAP